MTTKISGVLAGVAALLAATSASASTMAQEGRYEWRPDVQAPSPRGPITAPRRVWVPSMVTASAGVCDHKMAVNGDAQGMPCCENQRS
ncbi:hypothetical protein [Sphingomonas sp. GB1N7]|uniref:hypothetical protein n=1 Tax=Parasphingomonas caseinilytica TaxID=3096158 RepID=UPI002FC9CE77